MRNAFNIKKTKVIILYDKIESSVKIFRVSRIMSKLKIIFYNNLIKNHTKSQSYLYLWT